MSLVPALLVVSVIVVPATQEVRTQSVRTTNWSNPATWPNKKVPGAGDKVIIGKDKDVVLDVRQRRH
jgi:cell migration-inducing and hyaluronan-binding protein